MTTIRTQAIPKFPASVEAGDGIVITRSGGVFTFSVDPEFRPSFSGALGAGKLLFADSPTSIGGIVDATLGNVLLSGGAGNPPSYGKAGLTTHVSGVLPPANGGTGVVNSGTVSLGGNLATSGGALTFTLTGPTSLTLPTSGTVARAGVNSDIATMSAVTTISSAVSFTNNTAATSPTTGAIKTAGGIGSQGAGVFGGGVAVTGGLGAAPIAANVMAMDHQGGGSARFISYGSNTSTPGRHVFHQSSSNNSVFRDAFTVETDGGVVIGSPTGGTKGAGTLNATAVYDDNSLLTCMAVEWLLTGQVNLAKWDAMSPKEYHGTGHLFVEMLHEGFDPRDPAQYIARLQRDSALPGMPTEANWTHGRLSVAELQNRLVLAVEMLAIAFIGYRDLVDARLGALEGQLAR